MKLAALGTLVARELVRTRGALLSAGFGIAVGTAALVFFLGLGLGARQVLLGEVFPIDQLELEPRKTEVGLLSLLGGRHEPPGIDAPVVQALATLPGVTSAYPKLKFRFPSSARGGREILGSEIGTHEMVGDGMEPGLAEPRFAERFVDPLPRATQACKSDADCAAEDYCERPSGDAGGVCSAPVPALVSRYLVELFDHAVAPAHGLPPVAGTLLARADGGVLFTLTLGRSLLGPAPRGAERTVKLRVVGVSSRAIDLGVTLPLAVVQRWNREYVSDLAAARSSSVVVQLATAREVTRVVDWAATRGLVPHDTRARDVGVLIDLVLALLSLVALVILLIAALGIGNTFRLLAAERRAEIGLYRALGATRLMILGWLLGVATATGLTAGAAGIVVARLVAWLVDWRAAIDLPDFPFKPTSFFAFGPGLYLGALAFAAVASALGALGPTRRAVAEDPASALIQR